ncbi:glycosyltransferase [Paracoccus aerodenitrificans]|uniref:glycosyltransferase n=1 Tax=Paracoccus aerodenitrificans TaxID=3017781 RepID=UPI0022F0410C|nr:glycosyltransferase [Paracoccus aerodenitrificans]WBU63651.1 glycosyltransferase [Paracoccus aerodenitrificans]
MNQVFGYIRFSFLGRSDTRLSRRVSDDEERFRILYDPLRMEQRFYFFEKITLPSIRAQTDKDFRILVVSSEVMPDEYKQRLNSLTADIPQIEVIYSSAEHVTYEINPRLKEMTAGLTENTVHFRLDDDDAICSDMISLLRGCANRARENELLSFPRGFFLTMHDGKAHLLRKFEPYIAIAWAYVNKPGQIRSPYQGMHNVAYQYVPSMLDPKPLAYIHVSHDASDTRMRVKEKLSRAMQYDPKFMTEIEQEKIQQRVAEYFPSFTAESLKQIIENAPQ